MLYTYTSNYHPFYYYPDYYWVCFGSGFIFSNVPDCRILKMSLEDRSFLIENESPIARTYTVDFENRYFVVDPSLSNTIFNVPEETRILYTEETLENRTFTIELEDRNMLIERDLTSRIYSIPTEIRVFYMEDEGTLGNRTYAINTEDRNYQVPRCTDGGLS